MKLFIILLQETNLGLDMNGTHQVNALAVNTGKTQYMESGPHRGVITNEPIKIGSNSYEKVKTFKYLGSLLTNQNFMQEEIK